MSPPSLDPRDDPRGDLQAPLLLLAMPQVADPFFHRSVVLLLHHDEDGSFGFIVNRPTGVKVVEILEEMEIAWEGASDALAFFGGPVRARLGTVLFAVEDASREDCEAVAEVCPGVGLTQHMGDLGVLAQAPPDGGLRLFLGYAGWGTGQLVEEILRNDWITAPAAKELIFSTDPEDAWGRALSSVGIDPATLPNWTAPSSDDHEEAN